MKRHGEDDRKGVAVRVAVRDEMLQLDGDDTR